MREVPQCVSLPPFRPPDARCVTIWPPLQDLLQVGSRKGERRLFALVKQYALGPVAQVISLKARGDRSEAQSGPHNPNAIRRGERPARRDRSPGSTFMLFVRVASRRRRRFALAR